MSVNDAVGEARVKGHWHAGEIAWNMEQATFSSDLCIVLQQAFSFEL